ncbi:hypothetical protein ACLB2K_055650 [Fragaria x ananassa]
MNHPAILEANEMCSSEAYMGCFEMSTSSRPTWKSQAGSANEVPSCSCQLVFLMKPAVHSTATWSLIAASFTLEFTSGYFP